jgi:hypothetical protein
MRRDPRDQHLAPRVAHAITDDDADRCQPRLLDPREIVEVERVEVAERLMARFPLLSPHRRRSGRVG